MNTHTDQVRDPLLESLQAEIQRVRLSAERCTGDAERCLACRDARPYVEGIEFAINHIKASR